MKLAAKNGVSTWERQSFRWFRIRKRMRQLIVHQKGMEKTVLLVVGCQRSGTSMIHHLFRLDWDTVTYDEVSPLSGDDNVESLRLNNLSEVQGIIAADRAPFVVCKPLVESQNLDQLLGLWPNTRAIWMYRDFRDVVISNLEFFGPATGHSDLKPILAGDDNNWRSERLKPDVRETIRKLYRTESSTEDAAALFWYARNSLYFGANYEQDKRVQLVCYDELVSNPHAIMRTAYNFVGRKYPGDNIVKDVVSTSRSRGRDVLLSPPVLDLCTEMLNRLNACRGK